MVYFCKPFLKKGGSRVDICLVPSVRSYIEKVEGLLLKKEACNNLMLGLLSQMKHNVIAADEIDLGMVQDQGIIDYAFMKTPENLILADTATVQEEVLEAIARFLYDKKISVPGVIGPVKAATAFVQTWRRWTSCQVDVQMEQLIYRLDRVNVVPDADGKLVQATDSDYPLIKEWLIQFGIEAKVDMPETKAAKMARGFIHKRSVYLWLVDGHPVSMVNNARRMRNGATINAVFTPDEHKRKGYATNAVAALSQKLLDAGFVFCSLHTDLANPTSNNIYRKIGYYAAGTSIVYKFDME